jgi:hypothetical protein
MIEDNVILKLVLVHVSLIHMVNIAIILNVLMIAQEKNMDSVLKKKGNVGVKKVGKGLIVQ